MPKLAPPLDLSIVSIKLYREPGTAEILVEYPNANSYILELEPLKILLKGLRIKDRAAELALDQLWNSFAIEINLRTNIFYSIPYKSRYPASIFNDDPMEEYKWII